VRKDRFTLWLPLKTIRNLEQLQRRTGKGSLSEVVREAIEVYTSLQAARTKGLELYFEDRAARQRGPIWLLPGPPPRSR
jgi:hypothetical protein